MKIAIRQTTSVKQNFRGVMFFNGIKVSELHCTPNEYFDFMQLLHAGNQAMGGRSEDFEFETP